MGNGRYTNRDLLVLNFSLVLLVFFNFFLCTTQAGLSIDKECGDHKCEAHEYCSQIDHTCQPCNRICNKSNNNFDSNRCENDCQDYLHDIRYEKDKSKELDELQKDVTILTVIVVICLIVIILVGCALVAFTVYFWKVLHNNKSHESNSNKDKKGKNSSSQKGMELPTVYNNKYAPSSREVSPSPPSVSPTHSDERSPSKSEQLNNSINSSASMPGTVSTLVMNGSSSDTLQNTFSSSNSNRNHNNNNSNQQRFRREPSESTLPDYIPNGNPAGVGLRDSSSLHYSHHV